MNYRIVGVTLILGGLTACICVYLAGEGKRVSPETPKANITQKNNALTDGPAGQTPKGSPMNGPIDFWGKIVDQDGRPLPDVRVSVQMISWPFLRSTLLGAAKFTPVQTVTDSNGAFSITGFNGTSLSILSLDKSEFVASKQSIRAFAFGPKTDHSSSETNPVVLRMLRQGVAKAERLVPFNISMTIPVNGDPQTFDLLFSRKGEEDGQVADIRVALTRIPEMIPLGGTSYDWHAKIEMIDGGLIVVRDDLRTPGQQDLSMMYLAPAEGYVTSTEIHMARTDPNWRSQRAISFFFRSRNGQCHGRAVIVFASDYNRDKTGFGLNGELNSTGSRNLGQ